MKPIDELNDFLDKLIRRDFNAKIDGTTGDHSFELMQLKKSMTKLQIMLKVTEPSYVESKHGISYIAKAIELYEEMDNHAAAAKCYKQIGLLDLRDKRFSDALRCFRKAFKAYSQYKSGWQTIDLARLMVECLMQTANSNTECYEMIEYLEIIKNHSSNIGNLVQTSKADLEIARVLAKQGNIEAAEAKVAASRLNVERLSVESHKDSLNEHTLLVEAIIFMAKGQFASAARFLTLCITENPNYDPNIRYHAIQNLAEIAKIQGIYSPSLACLFEEKAVLKDIAVVLDCSERAADTFKETCADLRSFLKGVCKEGDRLGLVSAKSRVVVSKGLSRVKAVSKDRAFSQLKWEDPEGEADLSKAIELAVKLLASGSSQEPDFNNLMDIMQVSQPTRKQLLLVVTRSSAHNLSTRLSELLRYWLVRSTTCRLVVVGLKLADRDEDSLIELAESTNHGSFIHVKHIGLLGDALDWVGVCFNAGRACASLL